MSESVTSATSTSSPFGQAADDFSSGMSEAIKDNTFISSVKDIFTKYTSASTLFSLAAKIFVAALIMVMAYFVAKFICKIVVTGMTKKGTDHSIFGFIQTIIKATVYIIAVISALSSLGMNINSLIAALASAGVAIGLGLQGSISQLVSGIMIIINKPFKQGDFVEIKGVSGTISGIYIMYTVLHTPDNKKVIIPNSDITSNYIINYSAEQLRRCDVSISVSYSDDVSLARSAILGIAESCPTVLKEPEPAVIVFSHDSSAVTLQLRVWCNSSDYWETFFYIQEHTKPTLEKNGITIPFNQLDVHIQQD